MRSANLRNGKEATEKATARVKGRLGGDYYRP